MFGELQRAERVERLLEEAYRGPSRLVNGHPFDIMDRLSGGLFSVIGLSTDEYDPAQSMLEDVAIGLSLARRRKRDDHAFFVNCIDLERRLFRWFFVAPSEEVLVVCVGEALDRCRGEGGR